MIAPRGRLADGNAVRFVAARAAGADDAETLLQSSAVGQRQAERTGRDRLPAIGDFKQRLPLCAQMNGNVQIAVRGAHLRRVRHLPNCFLATRRAAQAEAGQNREQHQNIWHIVVSMTREARHGLDSLYSNFNTFKFARRTSEGEFRGNANLR